MRRICKILLIAFVLFGIDKNTAAWDSTAAKYMPLQIGNKWVYTSSLVSPFGSGTSIDKYIITGTQLINGKMYYNISGVHVLISGSVSCGSRLFSDNAQLRIDSTTMNLIRTGICNNSSEGLVDSLGAKFRDSSSTCYNLNSTKTALNDTSAYFIFNSFFRSKKFTTIDINGGNDQTYVEGIGLVKYYASIANYTCNQILKGCEINGVSYGDTSLVIGINQLSAEVPDKFSLSQNYPNPFNPVTKIKFDIPQSETTHRVVSTRLIVFDALGKEVEILINQKLQQGTYEADWDASDYPSGVYYYKLEVGPSTGSGRGFTETKKMVLIK